MINETVEYWAKIALQPIDSLTSIANCCCAHLGLLHDPTGISFHLSKDEQIPLHPLQNITGFDLWRVCIKTDTGTCINIRGVSSIPGEEADRTGAEDRCLPYIAGYSYLTSIDDPNITSLYLDQFARILGNNSVRSRIYGKPHIQVTTEDRLETIFKVWEGKYVITIQVDEQLTAHMSFINEIKDREIYRSPKFQNRRYNKPTDYLQCVIYKF
jgi:hypothetical protein